jgi:plasmid maintenance system antidote protein VapI
MKNNNLSATKFADKIGVPRSGLSHVLKGRNKASLDYVLKIIEHFPQINSMWLLTGKGEMEFVKNEVSVSEYFPNDIQKNKSILSKDTVTSGGNILQEALVNNELSREKDIDSQFNESAKVSTSTNKQIERIIIFFLDGSFKEYKK